jgi:hypothetical protein
MDSSPERVAFDLLTLVADAEAKRLRSGDNGDRPDRNWIIDTYAEILVAVKTPSHRVAASQKRT